MTTDITVTDSGVVLTVSPSGGGVVGVGIPSGGSTGQVLTKDTGANYDVSWQTPAAAVLASDSSFLASNVEVSTSWVDVLSIAVTAGTWLVTSTSTVQVDVNQRTISLRLYGTTLTTIASAGSHITHSGEPHGISLGCVVTVPSSQTLKLQAKMVTGSGTVLSSAEGLGATSTNLGVVQIS